MSEDDQILDGDLIRDGGSACVVAVLSGKRTYVRVMRSIGERMDDRFGKYKVKATGQEKIVESLDQIEGLEDLLRSGDHDLKEPVVRLFLHPKS
ncbi:MAG: hypothetical protein HKN27_00985 [Silicimonas sp.]|nr:hypothetical protein [Silicimonas sp.]